MLSHRSEMAKFDLTNLQQHPESERISQYGKQLISGGQVGVIVVAGGIGSRVGGKAPKTCQKIPSYGKSTIRHIADTCDGKNVPFAVMISPQTAEYVERELGDISYDTLFQKSKDGVPTGHGAVWEVLQESSILENWSDFYVDHVIVCLCDNPSIKILDPLFIGYAACSNADCCIKVVDREKDDPAGLMFRSSDNQHYVVDYRESDVEVSYGYTGMQMFPIDILRMHTFALPWRKNSKGNEELHIGDFMPAMKTDLFKAPREEFLPIKNKTGKWSLESYTA